MRLGVTESTKRPGTVRHLEFIRKICRLCDQLTRYPGSLAYLPRKRAARHRGKVKRLVNNQNREYELEETS